MTLILGVAGVLGACSTSLPTGLHTGTSADGSDNDLPVISRTWSLVSGSFQGRPLELEGHEITWEIHDDGTFSGVALCHNYSGRWDLEAAGGNIELAVSDTVLGEQVCENTDPVLTSAYFQFLDFPTSITSEDDQLRLVNNGGNLTFITAAEPELLAGTWILVSGSSPDGSIVPEHYGAITLTADKFGNVTGSSGCNDYSAELSLQGSDQVRITSVGSQAALCESPTVMQAEDRFQLALAEVSTVQVGESSIVFEGPGTRLEFTQ